MTVPLSRASISALAALGNVTPAEVAEIVPLILSHSHREDVHGLVAAWLTMTHHIASHVALTHLDRWLADPTSLGGMVTGRAMAMAGESGLPGRVLEALALEDAPPSTPAQDWAGFLRELGDDELRVLLAISQDLRETDGAPPAILSRGDLVTALGGLRLPLGAMSWLVFIARRLRMGQDQYGHLDLASDRRDWEREAAEERADEAVYRACAAVQRGMRAA